jgi:dihydroorotate dehydrogenase (fumarate)
MISTSYLGLTLPSPVILAASSLTARVDSARRAEEAGAGALVLPSLFEEQLHLEEIRLQDDLAQGANSFPEAITYFPEINYGDSKAHLLFVEKMRKAVKIPVIASLNACASGSWTRYARQLEEAGAEALELNVYAVATDPTRSGADIEAELFAIFEQVKQSVSIPVSVKLGPYYTSLAHVAAELDRRGAAGLVLFNRFLQPDIDPEQESLRSEMSLSAHDEMRLPLRWTGILHGRLQADLALNTGVQTGYDVVRAILAGATVTQTASALLRNGISYLSTMLRALEFWMNDHGYASLEAFRGRLSLQKVDDPEAFERAQYVGLLRSKTKTASFF